VDWPVKPKLHDEPLNEVNTYRTKNHSLIIQNSKKELVKMLYKTNDFQINNIRLTESSPFFRYYMKNSDD
jgi:hypothetical protein